MLEAWGALTLPTAATTPTVSCPGMRGNLAMNSPSWMCYSKSVRELREASSGYLLVFRGPSADRHRVWGRVLTRSVPHTPQALTLTRTSSSRSSGRGTSTIEKCSGFEYLEADWSVTRHGLGGSWTFAYTAEFRGVYALLCEVSFATWINHGLTAKPSWSSGGSPSCLLDLDTILFRVRASPISVDENPGRGIYDYFKSG